MLSVIRANDEDTDVVAGQRFYKGKDNPSRFKWKWADRPKAYPTSFGLDPIRHTILVADQGQFIIRSNDSLKTWAV